MSEQQAEYNGRNNQVVLNQSLLAPELRFVECDDNYTRIYANTAEIGCMEEESDNSFFIELYFLGSYFSPIIEGTLETAQEWVKVQWKWFYQAIHTAPLASEDDSIGEPSAISQP